MRLYLSALAWAAAILLVAFLRALGAIDEDMATTLLIVLPIVAWLSLRGRLCCFGRAEVRR
jgi:hypothetical protein